MTKRRFNRMVKRKITVFTATIVADDGNESECAVVVRDRTIRHYLDVKAIPTRRPRSGDLDALAPARSDLTVDA
jgi:hypothetical protein